MVVDCMNECVFYLYQLYNLVIFCLIIFVIEVVYKEGKWVGMCGEMVGDEIVILIFFGLGLDEFLMSVIFIFLVRI